MKWLIRYFFKLVRAIVGPIMLFIDWVTTPKGVERPVEEQAKLDDLTANMALYQFRTCPFCIKVRRSIKRQSLNIELRDAQFNMVNREQLRKGGGQVKVPCLAVTDKQGNTSWLYESNDIIDFLNRQAA